MFSCIKKKHEIVLRNTRGHETDHVCNMGRQYKFFSFQSDLGFSQSDMASMLGVSKRTVENRFAEFNLTRIERFSDMDDNTLDVYIERILKYFPRSGI